MKKLQSRAAEGCNELPVPGCSALFANPMRDGQVRPRSAQHAARALQQQVEKQAALQSSRRGSASLMQVAILMTGLMAQASCNPQHEELPGWAEQLLRGRSVLHDTTQQ